MPVPDDNVWAGTVGSPQAASASLGLIYQQLKIITLLLREGLSVNIPDEDLRLLAQPTVILSPPSTLPNI